jgi:tripartite-type tricarboxylate transporter receptor subunit TctC
LAITTAKRAKQVPDVPTVAEAGVPGYDAEVWWGFLGPAKLPADLTAKLSGDIVAALHDPVVSAGLDKLGATPVGSTPQKFDAYIHAEAAKWAPILTAANIRLQ